MLELLLEGWSLKSGILGLISLGQKTPIGSRKHVDNYTKDVDNYTKNVDHYTKHVDNYTKNVKNFTKYTKNVDHYTKNVDNYTKKLDNYTKHVDNYTKTCAGGLNSHWFPVVGDSHFFTNSRGLYTY